MIVQTAKMALQAVWGSKMRSFLTMLGIIIGVFALVVLVSLMQGSTDYIAGEISALGGSYYTVRIEDDHGRPLSLEDLDAVMAEGLGSAAPLGQTYVTGKNGRASDSFLLYGTTAVYSAIQDLRVEYGTFLRQSNEDNHSRVAVINRNAALDLMGTLDCLGEDILFNGIPFRIIGILAEDDGMSSMFRMQDYVAYIPYSTLRRLNPSVSSGLSSFYFSAAPEAASEEAQDRLDHWLLERFDQDEDAYSITDSTAVEETMRSVTGVLQALIGGIAAISLIVGGIGIMNIMLVSVTERTREIGIRKAIGAGRRTILLQFLLEALMLSLLGCALGLALSGITLSIVSVASGISSYGISPGVAVLATVFSSLIGLVFGLYPANKAAGKPPIEALRHSE